jgi:hypothetical protein
MATGFAVGTVNKEHNPMVTAMAYSVEYNSF